MQLITAIVRPFKVGEVSDALQRFGFRGMTVTEAQGIGKAADPPEVYRGREYGAQMQHHAKIEILAEDLDVKDLVEVIRLVASTGRLGDGKVWVTPVSHVVRIRTGEAGVDAVR
ncbi:P-II family nitrogen regulator [Acidothermaceae bacterium B102]|nr:P-II family nitrogen regulator [Acidothermaceae bacterium B102]